MARLYPAAAGPAHALPAARRAAGSRPYDRLIDGAFQVFLNRLPDPAGRADYTDALDRGALDAGVVLRAIANSPEARTRQEEVRLLSAPVP
ncbi:DUF4214 domain-containing protein [Pseudoroseomonas wenyumeiae]